MQLETMKVFCDLMSLHSFSKAAEANDRRFATVFPVTPVNAAMPFKH